MFESLHENLMSALRTLRGRGKLTEANMRDGLHLVQQIIHRHQGSIAVMDGDEGAVFHIILPKLDQTAGETGAFPCA